MFVFLAENLLFAIIPISEAIFSFIDIIIMYLFFSRILRRKKYDYKIYIASILAVSILLTVFALYNSFSSPNMLLRTIVAFIFGFLLFAGTTGKKIFYIALYSIVFIFVELLLFYSIELLFGLGIGSDLALYPDSIFRIIYKCLTKIIAIFILYFLTKRNRVDAHIPFKYMAFILAIYVVSIIALFFLFEICLHIDFDTLKITIAGISITSICIMISDIFVFIVFELLCKYFYEKQTAVLVEHQKNLTEKYILENEKNHKEVRRLWHDLDNHLNIIQAYLNENQSVKAKVYIDEVQEVFQNVPMVIKTGNEIADIVINQKRNLALEKNINFAVIAYIGVNPLITSSDLCILLSNSLDNAIEASEIVEEEKRNIHLQIKTHKQFLMIEIENYSEIQPEYKNGMLTTHKSDKLNHGLGVLSMESIVKKYDGNMYHEYSDNIFRLTIVLSI